MAKTTPWNKIKHFVLFLKSYEYNLNIEEAENNTNYKLKDYSKSLNGYYVYLLINPITKKVFYVGKGKKRRAEQHYIDFIKGKEKNCFKVKAFQAFSKYKLKPIIKIVVDGLEEDYAYKIEKKLIKRLYINLSNISQNENEPNVLKREVKKIVKQMPTYEVWLKGVFLNNPTVFNIIKSQNYGYEIYYAARKTILDLAKEYEICQT